MSATRQSGARRVALRIACVSTAVAVTTAGGGLAAAHAQTTGSAAPSALADCIPTYTPPVITGFSFTPTKVDVRKKAKKVAVTVKATDADKGVGSVLAIFASPKKGTKQSFAAATLKLSSGTAKNGTFKGSATVNRWVIPGGWKVSAVMATDKAGATSFLSYEELGSRKWQRNLSVKSTPDVKAPKLTSFSLSPGKVDTRNGTKKVTVTAKAKDSQSGVMSITTSLTRATSKPVSASTALKRVKGTANNGTYKGTITIPRWVGNATWNAQAVVSDKAFNNRTYTTAKLKAKKWKRSISVVSGVDSVAPTMTDESFSPNAINVDDGPASVTATATLKDSGSGVRSATITWTSPAGYQSFSASLTRISGTPASGTWRGTGKLGCFAEPGFWKASARVVDVAGNVRTYTTAQLAAAGWETDLQVGNLVP